MFGTRTLLSCTAALHALDFVKSSLVLLGPALSFLQGPSSRNKQLYGSSMSLMLFRIGLCNYILIDDFN